MICFFSQRKRQTYKHKKIVIFFFKHSAVLNQNPNYLRRLLLHLKRLKLLQNGASLVYYFVQLEEQPEKNIKINNKLKSSVWYNVWYIMDFLIDWQISSFCPDQCAWGHAFNPNNATQHNGFKAGIKRSSNFRFLGVVRLLIGSISPFYLYSNHIKWQIS